MINKYISDYCNGFDFVFKEHLSSIIDGINIEADVFEHNDRFNFRTKAHFVLTKGKYSYEYDAVDQISMGKCFSYVNYCGERCISLSKSLYGFTFINAETLCEVYSYFPDKVLSGGESFIVTSACSFGSLIILDGCYWAAPYTTFAYDYKNGLFADLLEKTDLESSDKTIINNDTIIIIGKNEQDEEKSVQFTEEELNHYLLENGKKEFYSKYYD
ncbi:MAG: hypothetical protein J6B48_03325 [Clostridia bacterium]|nr:hypothetical protein [Clostridia bacterium]